MQAKHFKAELLFNTLNNLEPTVKPTFFKSERDMEAMVERAFGMAEASESGKIFNRTNRGLIFRLVTKLEVLDEVL